MRATQTAFSHIKYDFNDVIKQQHALETQFKATDSALALYEYGLDSENGNRFSFANCETLISEIKNSISDIEIIVQSHDSIMHSFIAKNNDLNKNINASIEQMSNELNDTKNISSFVQSTDSSNNMHETHNISSSSNHNKYNSAQIYRHQNDLEFVYDSGTHEIFSRFFDSSVYDSLVFNFPSKKNTQKLDFIKQINVEIINKKNFQISIDEFKALIQIKCNNVFTDICDIKNIRMLGLICDDDSIHKIRFAVVLNKSISQYHIGNIFTKTTSNLKIDFVPFENLCFFNFLKSKAKGD